MIFFKELNRTSKIFSAIFLTATIVLFAYWLKTSAGIDFFEGYHLSRIFPFNYLTNEMVIDDVKPGVLLDTDFDRICFFGIWKDLWTKGYKKAERFIGEDGYNKSKCLCIRGKNRLFWTLSSKVFIRVNRGDQFEYTAMTKFDNPKDSVGLSIAAFDQNRAIIKYGYAAKQMRRNRYGDWKEFVMKFTITDDIDYIMPRLWGMHTGVVCFDNIRLTRKNAPQISTGM